MRTTAAIRRDIARDWTAILDRADLATRPGLPLTPKLLGSSTKTEKGRAKGIATAVVYMAPDREALRPGDKRTMCVDASVECSDLCLGHEAGLLITTPSKSARAWKTALFFGARRLFRELLIAESAAFDRRMRHAGWIPAVRVDGASDTGEGVYVAAALPDLTVYDYTKRENRARAFAAGRLPPNYDVTFSYSGHNWDACEEMISLGVRVAVVFDRNPRKGEPLPASWRGYPVESGDEHDARFLDPAGTKLIGLRFKSARNWYDAVKRGGAFVAEAGPIPLAA